MESLVNTWKDKLLLCKITDGFGHNKPVADIIKASQEKIIETRDKQIKSVCLRIK